MAGLGFVFFVAGALLLIGLLYVLNLTVKALQIYIKKNKNIL
ncbi:hypothetical protein DGWBC_0950 [Dehalogenimonas sp. WBC-2]|nr:hypothetical protein DGWBC_0950 [Dehalogenimonas sp. WBC-2]